jgi:hypothetical protein
VLGLTALDGTAVAPMPPARVQTGMKRIGQAMLVALAPLARLP